MAKKKETKICEKCGRELPLTEFYVMTSNPDGHSQYCKTCNRTTGISTYTDQQLYDELVRRGYEGAMVKTITLMPKV